MFRFLSFAICILFFTLPARAELKFCNQSGQQASIAIGYKGDQDWTSEGWWTVADGDCTVPVAGDLPLGHYYWRATSPDGAFVTENYYFCTSSKAFTIVGDTECEDRGYRREAFNEVETPEASALVTLTAAMAPNGSASETTGTRPKATGETYDYVAIQEALQGVWHDQSDDDFATIIRGDKIEDRFLKIVAGNATFDLGTLSQRPKFQRYLGHRIEHSGRL